MRALAGPAGRTRFCSHFCKVLLLPPSHDLDSERNNPYLECILFEESDMPHIHEVATLTSKGQITLPKSIRQALGIGVGAKIAFDLRGSEVLVTRVEETEHADPAIEAFLALLANDIQTGKTLNGLPADLAQGMFDNLKHPVDLEEEVTGDVSI
ncbi:transcriptional regulator, AbrB family [Acidithiobacillus ferrivorans SS3]|uniref:Transcriptional regulator, AbrB family n=2 Tax=Acidithiobacillus ferrivorans TaxID=160808 RepID=G0JSB0_9PROT|nr:transcriptional regulator, AbrB family [Acidithiobacillus ferrivorans SS3]